MPVTLNTSFNPVCWRGDCVELLDQRCLPEQETYMQAHTAAQVAAAIRDMVVRGAPAIGIAAAYGVVLAARAAVQAGPGDWRQAIEPDLQALAGARPTAVNLNWAIARMRRLMQSPAADPVTALLHEADSILAEDIAANHMMGSLGAALIEKQTGILTHCNAGALATGGYGTALGVVRSLHAGQKLQMVYACETRPWLQGARLTSWELSRDGIPVTLIADSAAGSLLRSGKVEWVIVGADRIAANGDFANKIGTYSHAVAARHHGIKFMVVAPVSTIDINTASGEDIQIEERGADEMRRFGGLTIAPEDARIYNPVFDVTPADLVDFLVTEKGVIQHPDRAGIAALLAS